MVFVSAPESTPWVAFVKSRVRLKHLPSTVGFEHGLGGLDGVLFRDVDREMHVTSAKSKVAEFKPEAFKIPECLGAGVNMRLFFKTIVVALGLEHHGHPVVSCVMRWLFMATAIYILHGFCFLSRRYRAGERLPRATRSRIVLLSKKSWAAFHLRVLRCCFRPRSILSRS